MLPDELRQSRKETIEGLGRMLDGVRPSGVPYIITSLVLTPLLLIYAVQQLFQMLWVILVVTLRRIAGAGVFLLMCIWVYIDKLRITSWFFARIAKKMSEKTP